MNKRQEKMLEEAISKLEAAENVARTLFSDELATMIHEAVGLIYLAVKHEAKLIR